MSQLTVRIQASHIRKMLLRRNQSATFRRLLSGLSDEQLLQMDREHHDQALNHLRRTYQLRPMGNTGNKFAAAVLAVFLLFLPVAANAQPQDPTTTNGSSVAVPFKWVNGAMIVRCTTPKGEQNCLFDTGAEMSVIDPSIAKGAPMVSKILLRGVTGTQEEEVREVSVGLGGQELNLPVVVMAQHTTEYKVILGSDFLRNLGSVQINYATETIEIGR